MAMRDLLLKLPLSLCGHLQTELLVLLRTWRCERVIRAFHGQEELGFEGKEAEFATCYRKKRLEKLLVVLTKGELRTGSICYEAHYFHSLVLEFDC